MEPSTPPLGFTTLLYFLVFVSLVTAALTPNNNINAGHTVTLDLQRNPDYAPNGPAAYARALRKWGAKVPRTLVKSLEVMGGGTGEVNAESIQNDREYLGRVGFGTPPQWLNVDLDTGSSDVWVYSSETKGAAGTRPVWKIEESSTAHKIENATWTISYGDGSQASGTIYHETITLSLSPHLTLPNATLESALTASLSFLSDPNIDGLFGLAYNLPTQTNPRQPSVLSSLLPHLARPLFTADLRWHSDQGGYTFGYVDESRYRKGAEVRYVPLKEGARYWEFGYTGFHVRGANDSAKEDNKDVWYGKADNGSFRAVADTGSTLLLMGKDVAGVYYGQVPGARQNGTLGGIWTFPCQLQGGDEEGDGGGGKKRLPDFEIGFENGFVVTVPGKYLNYTVMPDDSSMCMGGLQEWKFEFDIFGDVFLKAVYAVFDVGGRRIGFAEKELELD